MAGSIISTRYDMGSASCSGSSAKNEAFAGRVPMGQGAPLSMSLSKHVSHFLVVSLSNVKSADDY